MIPKADKVGASRADVRDERAARSLAAATVAALTGVAIFNEYPSFPNQPTIPQQGRNPSVTRFLLSSRARVDIGPRTSMVRVIASASLPNHNGALISTPDASRALSLGG